MLGCLNYRNILELYDESGGGGPRLAYIRLKSGAQLTADGVKIALYAAKIESMDSIAIRIMTPPCRENVEWRCWPR